VDKLPLFQVIVKMRLFIVLMIAQFTRTNMRFENCTHVCSYESFILVFCLFLIFNLIFYDYFSTSSCCVKISNLNGRVEPCLSGSRFSNCINVVDCGVVLENLVSYNSFKSYRPTTSLLSFLTISQLEHILYR